MRQVKYTFDLASASAVLISKTYQTKVFFKSSLYFSTVNCCFLKFLPKACRVILFTSSIFLSMTFKICLCKISQEISQYCIFYCLVFDVKYLDSLKIKQILFSIRLASCKFISVQIASSKIICQEKHHVHGKALKFAQMVELMFYCSDKNLAEKKSRKLFAWGQKNKNLNSMLLYF